MSIEHDNIRKTVTLLLEKYGALPAPLLRKLFCDVNEDTYNESIQYLLRRNDVVFISALDRICLNKKQDLKRKAVSALWVYSSFSDDLDMRICGVAQFPSQMFFLKKENETYNTYEIAVFEQGDEIFVGNLNLNDCDKCFVVIPSKEELGSYSQMITKKFKEKASKVVYAVLEDNSDGTKNVKLMRIKT